MSTQAQSHKVFIIHGPNLNLLGQREPEIYGSQTLDDINKMLQHIADRHHIEIVFKQSNHEGILIDTIHSALNEANGIIINPGAYTHTSIAIRDALAAYNSPIIEVHLSNIYGRETFRAESLVAPIVTGTISGLGIDGYRLALLWLISHWGKPETAS